MAAKQSVFSWHREPLLQPDKTYQFLVKHKINHLYQMLSPKEAPANISKFLEITKNYPIDLYFLIGEAEWALNPHAKEALRMIEWLAAYRGFAKGIVLDIEPHTLETFKRDPKKVMVSFVKALISIYNKISAYPMEVVVCLPYYFDTIGFEKELEQIVKQASDRVAIMNYYRGKEIAHMQTEARLVQRHRKAIETIYELQPPNTHELKDENTYYNYGLSAVRQNFDQLKKAYSSLDVHLSFHELRYFRELAEKGKEQKK